MSEAQHALLSASGAEKWIGCPGSLAMEKGIPNISSKYADEGTAAHEAAALALMNNIEDVNFYKLSKTSNGHVVDDEMVEEVQKYVDMVRSLATGKTLLVEQRVDYSSYIDVEESFGTSDAIIIDDEAKELIIIDLKYGKGISVEAEDNPQLMLYALGALYEFSPVAEFKTIRMIIHQPRLNHISEFGCDVAYLQNFAIDAREAATRAIDQYRNGVRHIYLHPGEKQCRWCRAKATCPALAAHVENAIGDQFENLSEATAPLLPPLDNGLLSHKMKSIPLIEEWCKAVRAEVERQLLSGSDVPDFKIVEGRKGSRSWINKEQAEALLKSFRLKQEQMYDFSLISPTVAEKLLKEQPRRWDKVVSLITRKDGSLSVAPLADKRQAVIITPIEDGFEMLELSQGE